jgi:glycosyltransferase involved in cell wall biosynthesis
LKKLKIYFNIPENNGVGYYRLYSPAINLKKQGLADVRISDFEWGDKDVQSPFMRAEIDLRAYGKLTPPVEKELMEIINWADVIWTGRKDNDEYCAFTKVITKEFKKPVIMDSDDNVWAVRPFNQGYQVYNPMNARVMDLARQLPMAASGVSVSTDNLENVYSEFNKTIKVLPNSIDFDRYRGIKNAKNKDKIVIGFEGGLLHYENLLVLENVIPEVLKKYKNVEFHCFGEYPVWDKFPASIKKKIKWLREKPEKDGIAQRLYSLRTFPKTLANAGFDIAVAPLADNRFNRAKSNLRWLEHSALKVPTVASWVGPYREITDGWNGFTVTWNDEDAWIEKLSRLIEDEGLRTTIGKNAYNDLKKDYDMKENCKLWLEFAEEVCQKYQSQQSGEAKA